jgi:hypothetical protein
MNPEVWGQTGRADWWFQKPVNVPSVRILLSAIELEQASPADALLLSAARIDTKVGSFP